MNFNSSYMIKFTQNQKKLKYKLSEARIALLLHTNPIRDNYALRYFLYWEPYSQFLFHLCDLFCI